MISSTSLKKLAGPSALALLAALSLGLGAAPASAALVSGLTATSQEISSVAAPQNAVRMTQSTKKKRRGSFYN